MPFACLTSHWSNWKGIHKEKEKKNSCPPAIKSQWLSKTAKFLYKEVISFPPLPVSGASNNVVFLELFLLNNLPRKQRFSLHGPWKSCNINRLYVYPHLFIFQTENLWKLQKAGFAFLVTQAIFLFSALQIMKSSSQTPFQVGTGENSLKGTIWFIIAVVK